jgi:hypothetical protein
VQGSTRPRVPAAGHHRPRDRPPDIDLDKAPLEPRLGLRWRPQVAHALGGGFLGVIVVDELHRSAEAALDRAFGNADRMIEDDDLHGAGLLPHETLHLGVVGGAQLGLVV